MTERMIQLAIAVAGWAIVMASIFGIEKLKQLKRDKQDKEYYESGEAERFWKKHGQIFKTPIGGDHED